MKFNVRPSLVIFILGFSGLLFSLIDGTGEIGSKIPLAVFFIFIMCIGIYLEIFNKDKNIDVFGEMEGSRDFG